MLHKTSNLKDSKQNQLSYSLRFNFFVLLYHTPFVSISLSYFPFNPFQNERCFPFCELFNCNFNTRLTGILVHYIYLYFTTTRLKSLIHFLKLRTKSKPDKQIESDIILLPPHKAQRRKRFLPRFFYFRPLVKSGAGRIVSIPPHTHS